MPLQIAKFNCRSNNIQLLHKISRRYGMKNIIKQALESLKSAFGNAIFTDPERFKSALVETQIEGDGKKIRNLLDIVICDMNTYSRLETALSDEDPFIIDYLTAEMSSKFGIDRTESQLMVECIAEFLGYTPDIQSQFTDEPENPTPVIISDDVVGDMILVQGGTFMMGGTPEQGEHCWDNEKPVHSVTVGDFCIGRYPVTQGLWTQIMGENPSMFIEVGFAETEAERDKLPVEQVSFDDAEEFIRRLNQQTGKSYRLPTEAEWEYVARGGVNSRGYTYAGSNNLNKVAWYNGTSSRKTHQVGTKLPNELGIYDMCGNVWEWVSDRYGDYSANAETNPTGSTSDYRRVFRGGSWGSSAHQCRVSFRAPSAPDVRYKTVGFRLALSFVP
jgi:formylglycine-generating enzyme required for sulfatase activity